MMDGCWARCTRWVLMVWRAACTSAASSCVRFDGSVDVEYECSGL